MKLSRVLPSPGYRRHLQIRRGIAAALVVAAVVTGTSGLLRTDPSVVVFARDLPVGATVTEADLRLVPIPAELIPPSAITDPQIAIGRLVVTAVGSGEVVTGHRVTGSPLLEGFVDLADESPDLRVVPVRLADPDTVGLLRHGDLVTVVTADGDTGAPVVVAHGGRVVVADPDNPNTVLIALPEEESHDVAAISLASPLGIVLTPSE